MYVCNYVRMTICVCIYVRIYIVEVIYNEAIRRISIDYKDKSETRNIR